jgi:hypothetical protein
MIIFAAQIKQLKMKALFDLIDPKAKQQLVDAISQITVLIAGAEGKINKEETEWAEKLTKIRSFSHHKSLQAFYETVGLDFHEKLHDLIESLPSDTEARTKILTDRLAEVDPILQKLPVDLGARLYKSFTSFAKHVAKSSGGFLGFGAISAKEDKLIKLTMLTPIIGTDEDEDGDEEHNH